MMKTLVRTCLVVVCCAATTPLASQELGSLTFPTSGAPAAQAAFLEGVKSLHSFQFDQAAALELSLQRTPNRTASVKALARAKATGTALR